MHLYTFLSQKYNDGEHHGLEDISTSMCYVQSTLGSRDLESNEFTFVSILTNLGRMRLETETLPMAQAMYNQVSNVIFIYLLLLKSYSFPKTRQIDPLALHLVLHPMLSKFDGENAERISSITSWSIGNARSNRLSIASVPVLLICGS